MKRTVFSLPLAIALSVLVGCGKDEGEPGEITSSRTGVGPEGKREGVRDRSFQTTQDILQAHCDLAGIFAIHNASALGAVLLDMLKNRTWRRLHQLDSRFAL